MSGSNEQLNNLAENLNPAPNAIAQPAGKDGGPRSDAEFSATPIMSPTAVAEQFPADFSRKGDPVQDTRMQMKLELQKNPTTAPGQTMFGSLTASDSDFEWLKQLREHEAEVNYDQWFAQWFDKAAPAQKEIALKLDPGFYERRAKLLDQDLALAKRLVHIKVFGQQSRDDVILEYACQAGFVDADRIENLLHPERQLLAQQKIANQQRFARGLLNPRRLPRGDFGGYGREYNAKALYGKDEAAFGPTPAYKLGTGTDGFSALGPGQDAFTEMQPGFMTQADYVKSSYS
jgi:hypothetical protein